MFSFLKRDLKKYNSVTPYLFSKTFPYYKENTTVSIYDVKKQKVNIEDFLKKNYALFSPLKNTGSPENNKNIYLLIFGFGMGLATGYAVFMKKSV